MEYNYKMRSYKEGVVLPNNQYALIVFQKDDDFGKKYDNYYVTFCISNKRRHAYAYKNGKKNPINGQYTGKTLHGLLWAKDKLEEFENYLSEKTYRKTKSRIIIQGDDSKRFRAYWKYLRNKGYKIAFHPLYGKYLYKVI